VLFAIGIVLAATILLFVGGFAETELLMDGQCGANGYLCEAPSANHTDHTRTEHRLGLR
jgi:hypothetical protein